MSYSDAILRADAQGGENPPGGLIPEDAAQDIIKEATEMSSVMGVSRRLPNMSRGQRRLPVLSVLPTAYFVNGDTGSKQTSKAEWEDVFVNAEEIAVIVPVPDSVLDDAAFDIWGEIRPVVAEAIGSTFDRAVLYGENAPAAWPDDLVDQITAANHLVTEGSIGADLYDDLLGEDGVVSLIEQDGYMVDGYLAKLAMRGKLRGVRDVNSGQPIFTRTPQEGTTYALDGDPITFPRNGSFLAGDDAELVAGDWSQLVYSVRQDITFKVLDQAVITDPSDDNKIVYNLAQQDMTALRVVFRAGWALPKPASRVAGSGRLPFAALTGEGS